MATSKKKNSRKSSAAKTSLSLAHVAEKAGVSKMTASRVLRGTEGYSADTRERVLKIANQMGYVPNRLAAAFGSETANNLVGICVPTLSRELYGQILEGLESKFSAVGRLRIGKMSAEILLNKISGSPVSMLNDVGTELIKGGTA